MTTITLLDCRQRPLENLFDSLVNTTDSLTLTTVTDRFDSEGSCSIAKRTICDMWYGQRSAQQQQCQEVNDCSDKGDRCNPVRECLVSKYSVNRLI